MDDAGRADLKPTERFGGRAEAYAKYRPRYPIEIIRILERETGFDPGKMVADVGSGTGILAELFLSNGNMVFCVEPNENMRKVAESNLLKFAPKYVSVAGKAEATTLDGGSVDLITAGQALHWFDVDRARAEFDRILKPGGRVAVVYNHRRDDYGVGKAYAELVNKYARDRAAVEKVDDAYMAKFLGNNTFRKFVLENSQHMDFEHMLGRLASASYMPETGSPEWGAIGEEVGRIIEEQGRDRVVVLYYNTTFYLGLIGPD